jgi:hypothetical protein
MLVQVSLQTGALAPAIDDVDGVRDGRGAWSSAHAARRELHTQNWGLAVVAFGLALMVGASSCWHGQKPRLRTIGNGRPGRTPGVTPCAGSSATGPASSTRRTSKSSSPSDSIRSRDAVERGLVLHRTAQNRLDGLDLHVESLEPLRELLAEPAPDPDLIPARSHHASILEPTGVTEPHPKEWPPPSPKYPAPSREKLTQECARARFASNPKRGIRGHRLEGQPPGRSEAGISFQARRDAGSPGPAPPSPGHPPAAALRCAGRGQRRAPRTHLCARPAQARRRSSRRGWPSAAAEAGRLDIPATQARRERVLGGVSSRRSAALLPASGALAISQPHVRARRPGSSTGC